MDASLGSTTVQHSNQQESSEDAPPVEQEQENGMEVDQENHS